MGHTYIYGVIDTGDETSLGMTGLDGSSPVYSIGHKGIGCVVSDDEGEMFQTSSREVVLRRLLAHQKVVEGAMRRRHTVLPVKFGTTLNTPEEVHLVLAQGEQQLAGALSLMQDKVELDVAATWDMGQVLQEVAREEEIVRARDCLARTGLPTLEQRVHLGQRVKASLDRRRDGYRKGMVDLLGPLAVDVASNVLVSDEMVMNVAFLVEHARQDEFDGAVRHLDHLFKGQITFRVVGPLPPYSFATVEIAHLSSSQTDEALRTLGLEAVASEAAVRKAYRRLAAQSQHNSRPGGETAASIARLRQASELLLQYSRAMGRRRQGAEGHRAGGNDGREGLFTVSIKRSESQEVEAARFAAVGAGQGDW